MNRTRGALIVIEGIDRTGKSTQCKKLVENLKRQKFKAEYTNFPARDTEIGKMINNYLKSVKDLPDEAIHLLFSANRWERAQQIIKTLEGGTTIVVDRYCYSGLAFSSAKGLDMNWCKSSDIGLPKPDKVFFLTMPLETIKERKGFGDERYEVLEFQDKVSKMYDMMKDESWDVLDASRSIEAIENELLQKATKLVDSIGTKPIGKIWMDCSVNIT